VLFAQNDAFSTSETGVFQQSVTDAGLEITSVQEFQTTDTDFTNQVTNVLNEQPELVVISGLAADSGNLVKQLRELGYTGLIVGGNGLNTPNLFPVCQAQCDGIIVAQAYSYESESDINAAFRAAYEESQERVPGQFSAQAFTAVQVIVEALNGLVAADHDLASMDIADLRTALNAQILAGMYDTPLGPLSFTPEGDIIQGSFYIAQVDMSDDGTEGAFVFLQEVLAEAEATPEAEAES
jgi:branched-chain amino acid transport system substrate-binding protein